MFDDASTSSSPAAPGVVGLTLKPGDKVQHFVVVAQIGAGGTSAVFKAHDALLNRHVAIKQVLLAAGEESDAYRARALAEAAAHKKAAASDPSMLVQLMDVVADPRGVLLVMEYVDGPSLEQILNANTAPMEERQALGIIAGVAKGLASLHRAGILHRDLKPANILMPRSGGLRITDFGLSVSAGLQQTMDQGTVRYLAPEILQGQPATAASDLYALGMIAYEALVGRAQFDEAFKAILRDQRNQSMRWVKWHTNPRIKAVPLAQLCPNLPPPIVELVERLMDKNPLARIGSATDLLEAIRRIFMAQNLTKTGSFLPPGPLAQGAAAIAFPVAPSGDTARIPKRSPWPLIAACTGGAVFLAVLGLLAFKKPKQPDANAQDHAHAIELMRNAEAAWKESDYTRALELFTDMQDGGKEHRQPGSLSRLFADAGSAKCRVKLAESSQDYPAALAALEEFRNDVKALEAKGKFPTEEVGLGETQKDLAAELEKELDPHKNAAAIVAQMQALLDEGKTSECQALGNERLNRPNLSAKERAEIKALVAQCSKSKAEILLEKLLAKARRKADDGRTDEALEDLRQEVKMKGEAVDPRVVEALASISAKANLNDLIAKYQKADARADKIAALQEILKISPDYADKDKLPKMQAEQILEDAQKAFQENDLPKTSKLIEDGLALIPDQPDLTALKKTITHMQADKALVDAADGLFAQGNFADAIPAYEKVVAQLSDAAVTDAAAAKIKLCKGNIQKAAGLALLTQNELDKAEAALKEAQPLLGDDAEVTAAFERIANARVYQKLRAEADGSLAGKNYGAAVQQYMKTMDFLKAHEGFGNADEVANLLRTSRFENAMLKLQDVIDRQDVSSANGYLSVAGGYAKTADEKDRVKQASDAVAEMSKKQR